MQIMRYGFIADSQPEEDLLRSNPAARVLFDPFLPALQARAIMAAVQLGVFEAMGPGSCGAEELAGRIACDPDALGLLLEVLVCAGYCEREEDRYRSTEPVLTTLLPDSPTPLTAWVAHNRFHWDVIGELEEVVRSGRGLDSHRFLESSDRWAIYQEAMLETAHPAAPLLASSIPVPEGAELLLDLGGSHGLYGALICRAHPPLRSVVIDLPEAIVPARELARREGIDDIVEHRAGDALTDDLGEEAFDVVLVANLIHHFTGEQNRGLFERIGRALKRGGTAAIWDFQPSRADHDEGSDLVGSGLALFWRLSSAARCHPLEEQTSWLESAGFTDLNRHPAPMPTQVLLTGRIPA
jgi:hypothetical protein